MSPDELTPPEPLVPEPPMDDELPPPPSDMPGQTRQYKDLKIKKSGPFATVKRAVTIFEKDLRTMAKHGLISAVILFIFLAVVFSIMSFSMKQAMQFSFEGDGDGKGIPGASGVDPPMAIASVSPGNSVSASTTVTLDATGSTDNSKIVYYAWSIGSDGDELQLFGEVVHYTFYAIGAYEVHLTVVDDDWNMNESSAHIDVAMAPTATDSESPMVSGPPEPFNINAGETLDLNGSTATDNIGVVNWTWRIQDVEDQVLYGELQSYRFDYAGNFGINLVARDAAGNTGKTWASVNVQAMPGDGDPPTAETDIPTSVIIGDNVDLSASNSHDNQGISSYVWYVSHNTTVSRITGERISFAANEFGPYEIKLIVRDNSGNYGTSEGMVIATPEGMEFSLLGWTSTPFSQDVSFNLLTYAYGVALLASVIYVGGLFAKGFTHEITKGTVKVLFFGPISVTTMVFSKILYPLIIGPIFIIPLVFIGLYQFEQPFSEVLMIALVSYSMAAITMVAAAYGSNLIYLGTKKMVLKPSVISRMFLYFSLIGTLTVFEWLSFVLDQWQGTTTWDAMYHNYSGIAVLSPFHQGGMFLSNALVGTNWALDVWTFAIPMVLIVGGVLASRKLYGDIFTRE
jgi:hypothetical protein